MAANRRLAIAVHPFPHLVCAPLALTLETLARSVNTNPGGSRRFLGGAPHSIGRDAGAIPLWAWDLV